MVEVLHRGCLTPFIVKQVLVGKSSGQVKVNPSQHVGSLSSQVGVQPLLELEEELEEDEELGSQVPSVTMVEVLH